VPAGGFAPRSRAAPGHHRPALRPVREELAGLGQAEGGQNTRQGRVPGNKGLELSQRGDSRWRVPPAERRKASAPIARRAAVPRLARPRRLAPLRRSAPSFGGVSAAWLRQTSDAAASRERFRSSAATKKARRDGAKLTTAQTLRRSRR